MKGMDMLGMRPIGFFGVRTTNTATKTTAFRYIKASSVLWYRALSPKQTRFRLAGDDSTWDVSMSELEFAKLVAMYTQEERDAK